MTTSLPDALLRSTGGRNVVLFVTGLVFVMAAAILGRTWIVVEDIGRDRLLTSAGLLAADDPLTRELLSILFPGYEQEIDALQPDLLENSEFSSPTLLLDDGRKVNVMVPRHLPFELAQAATPQVVILGTSRAREGVRPDVLSRALGGARVINLAVSGATTETMDVILDALADRIDGQIDTIIVTVDDVSFIANPENARTWRRLIGNLEGLHTFRGRVSAFGRELLDVFPRFERIPRIPPLAPFEACADPAKVVAAGRLSPPPKEYYRGTANPMLVDAFRRLVDRAQRMARQVVFVVMPVTGYHNKKMAEFRYIDQVRAVLGHAFSPRSLTKWGLSVESFMSAKAKSSCDMDTHHLNGGAAIAFSRRLVRLLSDEGSQ
jgi:hypothetical protein